MSREEWVQIMYKIRELRQKLTDFQEDLDRLEGVIRKLWQAIPDCDNCDVRRQVEDPEPPFDWREDEDCR